MYQFRLVQQTQTVQKLLCEDSYQRGAQTPKLVLLDQLVQIDRQQLEDQTQMLLVDEGVLQPQDVMIVILVHSSVEQVQHRDLHHTLIEVGCLVLHNLDRDHLLSFQVLALDYLTECTLTKNVQDQVSVLVVRLLGAQNVIDIQNVVAVFVVVTIILDSLARLCEYSPWIPRRFILESGVTNTVCRRKMGCQRLQRADETTLGVRSSERWLRVDPRFEVEHIVNFGHLWYCSSGSLCGRWLVVWLSLVAGRPCVATEHGVQLLRRRLWEVAGR